jgi:hypothetical protein
MASNKNILRENTKKRITTNPINFDVKHNYNFIRIGNITKKIRPIVLSRAITNFLNSRHGVQQILIEDEKISKDIKKKKKYILKEKAKNLIANEYK